jgi:hypothetical protein
MAQYTRFEIYIPVVYSIREADQYSGTERSVKHSLDSELVQTFIEEMTGRFHGVTQSNPLAPAPYKGWWQSKAGRKIDVDFLTLLFGLARIDESEEAQRLFGRWKAKFESTLHQDVILVLFYPVQTIGDFFDS